MVQGQVPAPGVPGQPEGWLSGGLRARFDPVVVIFAPPRSGSTALGRSLWRHPAIRYYLHEPFDRSYHDGLRPAPEEVLRAVLDRDGTGGDDDGGGGDGGGDGGDGAGIVIKEMTFQAGDTAAELVSATRLPVVLLVRDPRLTVSSRMRKREADGERPAFPAREAGWRDLRAIRGMLRRRGADYVVVDISDVRAHPARALAALCERLGLPWDRALLSWPTAGDLRLGQLGGRQDRWYERVLSSTGFLPPEEDVPAPEYFRARGMADVVAECLSCYQEALADPRSLTTGEPVTLVPDRPGRRR